MSIKIKVTNEMIQAAMETDSAPDWIDEARAAIEAALAIVERDINEAAGEDGNTGHMILIPNGCVEVSD